MLPTIINPVVAIQKLKQYRKIVSHEDAIEYLEEQLLTYQRLIIYQHFFPNEFLLSTAPAYFQNMKEPEPHTPIEIELFHLIDDNLFPINVWYQINVRKKRANFIPLMTNGIDWQEEGFDPTCLTPAWIALLPLSEWGRDWWLASEEDDDDDEEDDGEEAGWYRSTVGIPLKKIKHPNLNDANLFKELCSKAGHPLNLLPLALEILEHSTGNLWIDLFDYEIEELNELGTTENRFSWTIENVKLLADSYRESESIWSRVNQLINWLENDITTNFKQALKIWNRSSHRK